MANATPIATRPITTATTATASARVTCEEASLPASAAATSSACEGNWTGNWLPASSSTSLNPVGLEVNDSSMALPSMEPNRWNV